MKRSHAIGLVVLGVASFGAYAAYERQACRERNPNNPAQCGSSSSSSSSSRHFFSSGNRSTSSSGQAVVPTRAVTRGGFGGTGSSVGASGG